MRAALARLAGPLGRLHEILGVAGLMIGVFAVGSFGFGLLILAREYNRPKAVARAAVGEILGVWATAPDYLGLTLADHADAWRRSPPAGRPGRLREVEAALRRLGDELDRQGERFPLLRVGRLDLEAGPDRLARWQPAAGPAVADASARIPLLPPTAGQNGVDLVARYRVAAPVERTGLGLERSYRRLLLALAGLSGSSLLFFAYMVLHARALRDRVAREAAREATLDLADRTCHELGNGVFVLANERRNLADHIDLVERFIAEEGDARAEAAARVGVDPALAARWDRALSRAYEARGIDPEAELLRSIAMARLVCRQIGDSAAYIALTVRELDAYLKHSSLPVEPATVSVGPCIEEALGLLGPKLRAADARVDWRVEPGAECVRADRRLLIHALVNLIKNAAEAADAIGRRPEVSVTARPDPAGNLAWIAVADNGPGLTGPVAARVFDDGYTTKGPGRGRGLAIVRESIQAQGGRIEVAVEPGVGSTFRVGLPPAGPGP